MAMTNPMARAYLAQAKADLAAAELLLGAPPGICDSVLCMLFKWSLKKPRKQRPFKS